MVVFQGDGVLIGVVAVIDVGFYDVSCLGMVVMKDFFENAGDPKPGRTRWT